MTVWRQGLRDMPMKAMRRAGLAGLGAIAVLALSACGAPPPQSGPPPPTASAAPSDAPPPLMGGTPPVPDEARAPPPREPDFTPMAPIANPEDMSPAEREAVYGDRYDHPRHGHGRFAPAFGHRGGRHQASHHRARHGQVRHRTGRRHAGGRARHHAWRRAEAAPANLRASQSAPGLPPAPASRQGQLQSAFAGAVAKGAVLTTPPALAQGQPAAVTLSLPGDLGALLHETAARLGLAPRRAEVTASLVGQGYAVTPPGPQTQTLEAGRAPVFDWKVQPLAPPRGPLRAEVQAALSGAARTVHLSAPAIEQWVKPIEAAAPAAGRSIVDRLGQPGFSDLVIPGLVRVPGKSVAVAVLLILAVVLLVALARHGAAAAPAARERPRKAAPAAQKPFVLGQESEVGPFPAAPQPGAPPAPAARPPRESVDA